MGSRRRRIECFTVDVDGTPVLVRGEPGSMDENELDMLRDLLRAASRYVDERHEQVSDG